MDKFNRGGDRGGYGGNRGGSSRFGGNRGGFGGGKFGGNREGRDREVTMHDAVCDECKKKCQVPFRPSGDKPVYCSDCFGGRREDRLKPSFDRAPRRDFSPRAQTESHFSVVPKNNDEVKKQLDAINLKLDNLIRLVEMLSGTAAPKAVKKTVKK